VRKKEMPPGDGRVFMREIEIAFGSSQMSISVWYENLLKDNERLPVLSCGLPAPRTILTQPEDALLTLSLPGGTISLRIQMKMWCRRETYFIDVRWAISLQVSGLQLCFSQNVGPKANQPFGSSCSRAARISA